MSAPTSRLCPAKGTGPKSTPANRTVEKFGAARPGMLAPAVQKQRLRKILQMVESGSLCTIRDLAVEFNLSPSHLQHLFKQQTGARLGQWLIEQRLERAAHLLAHSNMSVKEIAYAVGYQHASSFVRAFERRFAQAPRYYRQQDDSTKC